MLKLNIQQIDTQKPSDKPLFTFLNDLGLVVVRSTISEKFDVNVPLTILLDRPVVVKITISLVLLSDGSIYLVEDTQDISSGAGMQRFKEV